MCGYHTPIWIVPVWHEWSRYISIPNEEASLLGDIDIRLHRTLKGTRLPYRGLPKIRRVKDSPNIKDIKLVVVSLEAPHDWWPRMFEGYDIEYTKMLPAKFR